MPLSAADHGQWAATYVERYVASRGRCEAYATLAAYHAEAAHKLSQHIPHLGVLYIEPGYNKPSTWQILDRLP
jgi:hypothetical protein